MAGINVQFNSVSLQTANILIDKITGYDDLPSRKLYTFPTARSDGSKLTATYFENKTITFSGRIIGTSVTDLDSRLDTLRSNIVGQEGNLDFDWNSSTRRYVATLSKDQIQRATNAIWASVSFTFLCSAAYGQDTASGTLLGNTTLTTTGVNTAVTPGGTAQVQQPIITLTVNSGTGLTAQTITISNPATSVGITSIVRTWIATDVMVVNCATKSVTINGVAADYSGAFPTWVPGSGNIRYADGFTTRNVTLSATYTKLYL